MRSVQTLVSVAALLAVGSVASADIIDFSSDPVQSTDNLGRFEGTLDYNPAQHKLTITITNTTPVATGGYLTGLAFRIESGDLGATASLLNGPAFFENTGTTDAPPFGSFVAGAALDGNWAGGGQPARGLAIGQTGVFEFNIAASDSASLHALDFIDVSSQAGPDMVIRFRGFDHGRSDKVPARPNEVVPSPAGAMVLCGAGLMAIRRRRR